MATEPAEESGQAQPSFQGRLQLHDFAFKDPIHRSPRLSTPLSAPPTPPSKPRVGTKRKALTEATTTASSTQEDLQSSVSASSQPTKKKARARPKAGYAPPSTYAHLPHLVDVIAPNLILMFVGLNPGIQTASTGHAYAHPSNLFWKLLASSGITPVPCRPEEDRTLPARFALGNTNIVSRPSRNGAELKREELDAGVETLERKARRWRPEAVCIVGKSIWESLWRVRHGKAMKKEEFSYGWQKAAENMGVVRPGMEGADEVEEGVRVDGDWSGARVFVATSTSGLAASLSKAEKEKIWRELGSWVEKRRAERESITTADS